MVHFILLLLAPGADSAGGLSDRLVDSAAFSHCGDRRARCLVILEGPLFPSGEDVARTASDLDREPYLRKSNSIPAIPKSFVLAAKWLFLEWFAAFRQDLPAVETLWKLFCREFSSSSLSAPTEPVIPRKTLVIY